MKAYITVDNNDITKIESIINENSNRGVDMQGPVDIINGQVVTAMTIMLVLNDEGIDDFETYCQSRKINMVFHLYQILPTQTSLTTNRSYKVRHGFSKNE